MADVAIIRILDEAVVNRIAAGEVIQRPANGLKEMIENSLDAKATNIQVTVRDGGLKLMIIQDNGTGIRRDDMEIVCERFTTSKIRSFDDLATVATYGFRGEALASVSHVAHVTIVTRTADAKCAFRGRYCDGKLKEPVKPCAGNVGAQITVEDLFYNVPMRRKALKSSSEEYQKIIDIVSKYAVHNSGVGFTLKKQGDSNSDVKTPPTSTQLDNVRTIYGSTVARELLDVKVEDSRLGLGVSGLVSNANYNVKRATFLLFINNRLVDSSSLRKAIEAVYTTYLPKNTHPFVYLSLSISPQNVDVNIHPTKHEVHFLHEDAVVEVVQRAIDTRLLNANSSRTYYMQTLKPVVDTSDVVKTSSTSAVAAKSSLSSSSGVVGRVSAQHLVRTDSREQKLDAFLVSRNSAPQSSDLSTISTDDAADFTTPPLSTLSESRTFDVDMSMEVDSESCQVSTVKNVTSSSDTSAVVQPRREIKLTSVLQLRSAVESDMHSGLRTLLQNHTFVGCVSPEFALLQHDTKLYLVNTTKLSIELFYQLTIYSFGNMGYIRLSESASIHELAVLALDSPDSGWSPSDGPKQELAQFVVDLLTSKADMLADYFSLQLNKDGNLLSLPLVLDKYTPSIEGLPMYLLRLATEVDWDTERPCFETFARETADFYAVKAKWLSSPTDSKPSRQGSNEGHVTSWQWTVEHVIYPAARASLMPPKRFAEDGTILEIANMPDLYRVFERC